MPKTWNNFGGYSEAYLAPPEIQEAQMAKLEQDYESKIPEFQKIYPKINQEKAKALQHFLGLDNALFYVNELITTGNSDLAQQALDKRLGNKYANLTVTEYLRKFANK